VRTPERIETASAASVDSAPAVPESSTNSISANRIPVEPVTASAAHGAVAPEIHEVVTAGVEAAAVAAATETGADHHNIAQAVHRVMERLKPELVEEIMRELRPKK
jgi:hypothetical protein